jgi:hypothetical protein
MVPLDNILKSVDKAVAFADKSFESEQEAQKVSTDRLSLDLTSPYKLPHFIRPILALGTFFMWATSIIWTLIIATVQVNPIEASLQLLSPDSIILYILGSTTTTFGTTIGFYFHSRRKEKVQAKKDLAEVQMNEAKLKAAIALEKIKAELALKQAEAEIKETRKDNRRARRN